MKTYLGDSVYAEIRNGMICLTTENGGDPSNHPSNEIFLEPEVWDALKRWEISTRPRETSL